MKSVTQEQDVEMNECALNEIVESDCPTETTYTYTSSVGDVEKESLSRIAAMRGENDGLTDSEQLHRTYQRTFEDGSGELEIIDWCREDSKPHLVRVDFLNPRLEQEHEYMNWPETRGDESKFIDLIAYLGGDPDNPDPDVIKYQSVRGRRNEDGDWVIIPSDPSIKHRLRRYVPAVNFSVKTRSAAESVAAFLLGSGLGIAGMAVFAFLALLNGKDTEVSNLITMSQADFGKMFLGGMALRTVAVLTYALVNIV